MERFQQQYRALGSEIIITLVMDEADIAHGLMTEIHNKINAFECQFSRFLPDSELTAFNRRSGKKVRVSDSFLKLLQECKRMAVESEGIYNPFILPALQQAGYLGSWPNTIDVKEGSDFSDREVVSYEELTIGDGWAQIPKRAALDFGGIGKGYLLDELAGLLRNYPITGYWFSLGGDIVCGGNDTTGKPWEVGVQSALNHEAVVDTISNVSSEELAIATSGVMKRRGVKDGSTWHHIIDPRTGLPSSTNILTVTVTAKKATNADVYAKCIVIAGADKARYYQNEGIITSYLIQAEEPEVNDSGKVVLN